MFFSSSLGWGPLFSSWGEIALSLIFFGKVHSREKKKYWGKVSCRAKTYWRDENINIPRMYWKKPRLSYYKLMNKVFDSYRVVTYELKIPLWLKKRIKLLDCLFIKRLINKINYIYESGMQFNSQILRVKKYGWHIKHILNIPKECTEYSKQDYLINLIYRCFFIAALMPSLQI